MQLVEWLLSWSLFASAMGTEFHPVKSCNGIECYEVFSCRGFSGTTAHIREPLSTLTGVVLFPVGVVAALHGYRFELKVVATYLAVLTAVYIGCFIGDVIYYETCNAYPLDAIEQALLWPIPFPLRRATQDQLSRMNFFPKSDVMSITHDFGTMKMYLCIEFFICLVLVYTAREARLLGMLFERGPLGLGVHYGLDQFDEVLNHEALLKRKEPRSFFVEDGQLPQYNRDAEMPLAYHIGHNYGAFTGKSQTLDHGPSDDMDHWQERSQMAEAEFANAEADLQNAAKAYEAAREVVAHEKEEEANLEQQALNHFREHELHRESHQEHRAEDLAQDAADEALARAQDEGKSEQEARFEMATTYQQTLSKHHRKMLEMARARALHQHYRHVEREHKYEEMESDAIQNVQEAQADIQSAQMRMQQAQELKMSLGADRDRLVHQRLWKESMESEAKEKTAPGEMESPVENQQEYPRNALDFMPPTLPPGSFATGSLNLGTTQFRPSRLSPPGAFSTGSLDLGTTQFRDSIPPPPLTLPMGSLPLGTTVMQPPRLASPTSYGTSGNFGTGNLDSTATFGARRGPSMGDMNTTFGPASMGAVPSTLPRPSMGFLPQVRDAPQPGLPGSLGTMTLPPASMGPMSGGAVPSNMLEAPMRSTPSLGAVPSTLPPARDSSTYPGIFAD
jgi:hypothetical protein